MQMIEADQFVSRHDHEGIAFSVITDGAGRYFAVRDMPSPAPRSPCFCMEARSAPEAVERARTAIKFYLSTLPPVKSPWARSS